IERTNSSFFGLVFTCHQLAAQELANGRFRNTGDEDVTARALEIGQARFAAEFIECDVVDRSAALDERGDDLAQALISKPNHRYFQHSGMQRQAALNLDR